MACHISTFHWQAHSLSVFYWLNYLRIFRENIWENISTSKKVITYSQDSLQAWEKLTSYWWALGLTNNIKKDITLNFQWVYFIFVACAQLRNLWWFCAARFWSKSKSVLLWLVVWMDCWLLRWLSCCAVFFIYFSDTELLV